MGKINIGRVLLGGIVAGLVSDALGYLVDGVLLAPRWSDGMLALGHSEFSPDQWIWFNLLGLVAGIVLIWIYAAIRPRFGAGPKTAILAGLAVWIVGSLLPNLSFMWFGGLFSRHLTAYTTSAALIEILAGALACAALYSE
jgi:xanthosine utilization system XapX-like protein